MRSLHRGQRERVKPVSTEEDIYAIPREFAGSGKEYEKAGYRVVVRVDKSNSSWPRWGFYLLYDGYKVYRH